MNNIYMVGFMGTGKTAVGRELARQKKMRFLDLDELIELRQKQLICDIFAKKGEPYFRKLESRMLKEVSSESGFTVACGGGIVINPANIRLMKRTGTIICLTARSRIIIKRTQGQVHRPLLNVKDQRKQIEQLLKLRAPYYVLADKIIDTSKLTVKQVAVRITKLITKSRLVGVRR